MKKILAILLTFILTFSCYSVLGVTVSADEATAEDDKILIASDYNADSQRWSTYKTVNNVDENSDGVTDYIQLDGAKSAYYSYAANLTPGVQYEFSFYARVPEDGAEFTTELYPTYAIYLPQVADTTTMKSTSRFTVSATATTNNFYAYKNMRHNDFSAVWTVGSQEPLTRTRYSNFDPTDKTKTPNEIYSDWTKVTAVFTACEPTEGDILPTDTVDNRVALSIGLRTDDYAGMKLDVKDIVLKEYEEVTEEPEEPETPEDPETTVRGPEFTEDFEDFAVGTKLYDHTLTGVQNMYSYSSKAALLTTFGSLEVVSGGHTGGNALTGKTYYQYAAMPVNLTPNTEYELSFWYTYTTSDADRYLNKITYGLYVPDPTNKKMTVASGKAGIFEASKVFAPNNSAAGIWQKATLNFTTGDNVDNLVFAYTYHDKLKSDISATVNKCPLYIDDVSIKCAENVAPKAEIAVDTKDAASVQFIGGYFKDFAVGDKVEFAVRTMDELAPVVSANGTTLTADSNGNYSFVALEENVIKVECEGDENRFDPNVDKYGRPLYEYNEVIAATPIWEGDTVYHETVLFIPGRETAKLLYPIDKVISVRSYDLTMNYLEGVDYEITEDGLLKILEGSKIPVFAKPLETTESNSFPVYGKEDTYAAFISDYDYPAYAIAVTYEYTEQWPNDEGYNPETIIESQKDKIPEVFKKLENGEEVNVVIFGDSASCGLSTSGLFYDQAIYQKDGSLGSNVLNFAPFTPAWPVMLEQNLKKLYPDAKITFKNIALGGQTARWGKGVIKERLGYLERDAGWANTTPDLMILAFGGNDLTAGHTAEEFGANMQAIINEFRDYTGTETEVLIWSEYVCNTSVVQYQPENLKANREQCYSISENNEGVGLVDSMSVFFEVLESKEIYDIFNDNMVHGNDFLTRTIAQCLIAGLSEPQYLAGDINGDESINLKDLVTLAQYVAKWENLTVNQAALDVDGNGVIDLNDVTHFAQYLAGWEGIEIY